MDSTQIELVSVGVTRAKLKEMVDTLSSALQNQGGFDITFYGVPNGEGPGEIQLQFSNDDMEADINPDIDPNGIYIDFSEY